MGPLRLHALLSDGPAGAPPVVLLPGLVTASRSMVPLARALTRHGLRPWILDPAGFGYSDKPPHALAIREQADIVAEWLQVEGLTPARLLGNSAGSQVAAAVAGRHDVVSRLVLLSPTLRPAVRSALSWMRAVPARTGRCHRPGGGIRVRLLEAVHDRLGDEPSLRALNVISYAFAGLPRAVSTARYAVEEKLERDLPGVRAPTLLVRADRDPLSSASWVRHLTDRLADGRSVRLPDVNHTAFYLAAETVANVVGPFLTDGSRTTPSADG
ncbi:alpha/beta fold hydrolase [Pseudonocardia sp.]|uniref:alpha/beta fold hydrolase n=1 Tax=Pseudonocardia sp. TaxID=60912 RepID=UPI0026364CDB|nr:alpha/beta fold hydrolase [Pseudonocardia sp.]